jgi:alanine racemase
MTAPANLRAPLRRALVSKAELAEAFISLAGRGKVPDLRCNAYGLGITEVSQIARDTGVSHAVLSEQDMGMSALLPEYAESGTAEWLDGPHTVVTFEGDVVSLKRVPEGTPVSYGYQYRTTQETTLALVSVGFADGVPRTASFKGHVSVGGASHPIAGRIAMDQMVVDIGDSSAQLGDTATVWGSAPTLAQWSQWSGRPSALLVAQLAPRVVKLWQ